jgi:hypothetical protein
MLENKVPVKAEWVASGGAANREGAVTSGSQAPICVNDLILAFWAFAEQRYVKNGKPTSKIKSFRTALRPLRDLYGSQTSAPWRWSLVVSN